VCSSTSTHASADPDVLARDLGKLAMLALPLGIKVAYEGLSWGRTINEFTMAWDIVCRAGAPNLGKGSLSKSRLRRSAWAPQWRLSPIMFGQRPDNGRDSAPR